MNFYYLLLLTIPGYFFFLNFVRYLACKRHEQQYLDWLDKKNIATDEIHQTGIAVQKLLRRVVADDVLPMTKPIGYGKIASFNANIIDQYPTRDIQFAPQFIKKFWMAKGAYKERMWDSVNPFCWLQLLFKVPVITLTSFGLDKSSNLITLFKIIWGIIVFLIGSIITLYPAEIKLFLDSKILQLFK